MGPVTWFHSWGRERGTQQGQAGSGGRWAAAAATQGAVLGLGRWVLGNSSGALGAGRARGTRSSMTRTYPLPTYLSHRA